MSYEQALSRMHQGKRIRRHSFAPGSYYFLDSDGIMCVNGHTLSDSYVLLLGRDQQHDDWEECAA
jgi:hypothetical protein